MKPSIGRIVHFVASNGVHLPAIIVAYNRALGTVALQVFHHPTQNEPQIHAPLDMVTYDDSGSVGHTWHWPEREE